MSDFLNTLVPQLIATLAGAFAGGYSSYKVASWSKEKSRNDAMEDSVEDLFIDLSAQIINIKEVVDEIERSVPRAPDREKKMYNIISDEKNSISSCLSLWQSKEERLRYYLYRVVQYIDRDEKKRLISDFRAAVTIIDDVAKDLSGYIKGNEESPQPYHTRLSHLSINKNGLLEIVQSFPRRGIFERHFSQFW